MAGNEGWFRFSGCGFFWLCFLSRISCLRDVTSIRRSFSRLMIVNAQEGVTVDGDSVVERVLESAGTLDAVV